MADLPEVRSQARPEPPRQLYDRPHAYGVGRDLELMKAGFVPPARTPRIRTRASRRSSGRVSGFRSWNASREHGPTDLWHRLRCRTGHHELRGGHQMQLGSRFVYVERRCTWCGAQPPL